MIISVEDKLLFAAARLHPSDDEILSMEQLISNVNDWDNFTNNVIRNSVGPLIYKNLSYAINYSSIPDSTISKLKQTYYQSFFRNEIIYKNFNDVINAISELGTPVIALKGIFLVNCIYKDLGIRQMSDIDLLVKVDDADNCKNSLINIGFVSEDRYKSDFIKRNTDTKHLPQLFKENIPVELHLKIHPSNCEYYVDIDDYWQNALPVTINNSKCLALSPNDLLQHLCLHLDYHFMYGKIQLYSYCDIAAVLKFYKDEFNWDTFNQTCIKYNCTKNVYRHLYIINKYFGVLLPEEIQSNVYQSFDDFEHLFISYFKGDTIEIKKTISNTSVEAIKRVSGFGNKFKYLMNDIFPSSNYMRKRYQIKSKWMIFLYYLVRLKAGLFELLFQIKKAIIKK